MRAAFVALSACALWGCALTPKPQPESEAVVCDDGKQPDCAESKPVEVI